MWDQVLATKRRCSGFFVPDHTVGLGRNILLVSKFDEHECLPAYRRGSFYGAIQGSGLSFEKIDLQGNILQVAINKRGRIRVVADSGEPTVIDQRNLSFQIPLNSDGSARISYLRIELRMRAVNRYLVSRFISADIFHFTNFSICPSLNAPGSGYRILSLSTTKCGSKLRQSDHNLPEVVHEIFVPSSFVFLLTLTA